LPGSKVDSRLRWAKTGLTLPRFSPLESSAELMLGLGLSCDEIHEGLQHRKGKK